MSGRKTEHERRIAQNEEALQILLDMRNAPPRSLDRDVLLLKLLETDIMPYSRRERMGTKRALRRAIQALEKERKNTP